MIGPNIGPIIAIILFIAAGLALSAWSILRRAARGKRDDRARDAAGDEPHLAMGVDTQAEASPPEPV
jgi:hypothetical protein